MITRFNKYEKLLEDSSWLDNPLVKTVTDTIKSVSDVVTKPFAEETINIDPEFIKMYEQTPIGQLPGNVYAKFMGLTDIDQVKPIVLEGNLTGDSSMMEIAHNYYLDNIGEIIQAVDTTTVNYSGRGIDRNIMDELNKNPITVGTIISNSIKDWFNSETPSKQLTEALTIAKIEVREEYKSVSESIDYYNLNESKFGEAIKLITNHVKNLRSTPRFSNTIGRYYSYVPKSTRNLSSFNGYNKTGSLGQNVFKAIFGKGKDIDDAIKNPNTTSLLAKFFSKAGEMIKKPGSSIKQWILNRRTKQPNNNLVDDVKKGGLSTAIKKGFLATWGITKTGAKWGVPLYSLYWLADSWGKNDQDTAKEPTREFFTFFEKDMSNRGYTPFSFYDYSGEIFSKIVKEREDDWRELLKGWCSSLAKFGILSSSNLSICLSQINSPTFEKYMVQHSNVSNELIQNLQSKWQSKVELPSLGLYSVGIMTAFGSLMSKFENEIYSGKVPVVQGQDTPGGKTIEPNILQVGDSNDDVAKVQTSLQIMGYYNGEINGVYSEELKTSVTNLQTEAKKTNSNIQVTGKVDAETLLYISEKIKLLDISNVQGDVKGEVKPRELEYRKEAQTQIDRMKSVLADR